MRASTHVVILVTLLALLPISVATAQDHPVVSNACALSHDRCSANCYGLEDTMAVLSCLIECDNLGALCTRGDEKTTLSSADYLAQMGENPLATKAGACHATTTCPAEYSSCASWSTYSDCGDPFCSIYRYCGDDCPDCEYGPCLCFGDAMRQNRERYRVCFNQQMQGCTEYQRTYLVLGCGCW